MLDYTKYGSKMVTNNEKTLRIIISLVLRLTQPLGQNFFRQENFILSVNLSHHYLKSYFIKYKICITCLVNDKILYCKKSIERKGGICADFTIENEKGSGQNSATITYEKCYHYQLQLPGR